MENPEKSHSPESSSLREFKDEIRKLADEERMETRPEKKTIHFRDIDVDRLTIDDMRFWECYKKNRDNISETFLRDLKDYCSSVSSGIEKSSRLFAAYINNKVQIEVSSRESRLLWGMKKK